MTGKNFHTWYPSRAAVKDHDAQEIGFDQAHQVQLDQAESLFRDMDMDWWTEQAEGLRGRIDRGEEFVWFAPYVDGPPSD